MGTGDARGHANFGDILAVCDVDKNHAERARVDEKIGKQQKRTCIPITAKCWNVTMSMLSAS